MPPLEKPKSPLSRWRNKLYLLNRELNAHLEFDRLETKCAAYCNYLNRAVGERAIKHAKYTIIELEQSLQRL